MQAETATRKASKSTALPAESFALPNHYDLVEEDPVDELVEEQVADAEVDRVVPLQVEKATQLVDRERLSMYSAPPRSACRKSGARSTEIGEIYQSQHGSDHEAELLAVPIPEDEQPDVTGRERQAGVSPLPQSLRDKQNCQKRSRDGRVLKSLEFDLKYSSDVQEERKRQGRSTSVVASLDTAGTRRRRTCCQPDPVEQSVLELHAETDRVTRMRAAKLIAEADSAEATVETADPVPDAESTQADAEDYSEEEVKAAVRAVLDGEDLYECQLSVHNQSIVHTRLNCFPWQARQIREKAAEKLGGRHKKLIKNFVEELIDNYQLAHPKGPVTGESIAKGPRCSIDETENGQHDITRELFDFAEETVPPSPNLSQRAKSSKRAAGTPATGTSVQTLLPACMMAEAASG